MLYAYELVPEGLEVRTCPQHGIVELPADGLRGLSTTHPGKPLNAFIQFAVHERNVDIVLLEQELHRRIGIAQQRLEQMSRIYGRIRAVESQLLRFGDRFLSLDGKIIQVHIVMIFLFKLINSKLVTQNPNQDLNPAFMSEKILTACRRFSFFALTLLFCLPAFAQPNFDAVDQLLKQNQKALGGGYAVVVWKDGKVIYHQQSSPDFTPKTLAPIGNAGDWMTAALVMTFVDEGKLSLDDKITRYIPLFGKYMKGYITIRNCLTHTTGIKVTNEGLKKMLVTSSYQSLEDVVNDYASKRPIQTNPGTEFFYSNLGPNI